MSDINNDNLIEQKMYIGNIYQIYNLESLIIDIKKNIRLLENVNTNNKLFLRIILNIQIFLLDKTKSDKLSKYEQPVYSEEWLHNSTYNYIFNLLSILFHKKTRKILEKFISLIKSDEDNDKEKISIYNYFNVHFSGQNEAYMKDKILEDILTDADKYNELLFMEPLNDIKTKIIDQFINLFIEINKKSISYRQIIIESNDSQILNDFLLDLYNNSIFKTAINDHHASNPPLKKISSVHVQMFKEQKLIETILTWLHPIMNQNKNKLLEYNLKTNTIKLKHLKEKFNFIKQILIDKNIENPFFLIINKLNKSSDMNGYIIFINHLLYHMLFNTNGDRFEIKIYDYFGLPYKLYDSKLLEDINRPIFSDDFEFSLLNKYCYKNVTEYNKQIIIQTKEIFDFQNKPENKIFFDRKIDLFLQPTNDIISYYESFFEFIDRYIKLCNQIEYNQLSVSHIISDYVNECVRKSLKNPLFA